MALSHGRYHRGWICAAVERYEGRLVRYAMQITHDVELARDVVQDTFLKLCRESPENIEDHLAQWLFTVCRRRALDVRRKEKRMKTITDERAAAEPSRQLNQEAMAEQQEEAARIENALMHLSENQQEVVRLKFQNGLSYREISAITELSVSNVGYLLHTALTTIRQQLADN